MTSTTRALSLPSFLLVTCGLLAACGGSNAPLSASATIGASGGALVGPGGSGVVVPAGAVGSDTTISVTQIPRSTPPAGTALVAEPIRLAPEGKTFTKPVEVSITVPSTQLPPGASMANVVVMRAPAGTQNYVPLPTRAMGDKVTAVTEHFSDFIAVVASGDGGLPFGACGDMLCDVESLEDCNNCPLDCGLCLSGTVDVCYDGVCNGRENYQTCPFDCGITPDCYVNNGGCDPNATCEQVTVDTVLCTCGPNLVDENGDGTLCTNAYACPAVAPCLNGGTCTDVGTRSYCTCPAGFGGPVCEKVTSCTAIANGGCDPNASCTDFTGQVVCTCIAPYFGTGYFCANSVGICGDGIVDANERCDDGGQTDGDGCSSSCRIEPGYSCTPGSPSTCSVVGCVPSLDTDTGTFTYVFNTFGFTASGLDLDGLDDSAGASIAGCGVVDGTGGVDAVMQPLATSIADAFDLFDGLNGYLATLNQARIVLDHYNGTSDDPCVGITLEFDSIANGVSSVSGAATVVGDAVTAALDGSVVLYPTVNPIMATTDCIGGVCSPAVLPIRVGQPRIALALDPMHFTIVSGTLAGVVYYGDPSTAYTAWTTESLEAQVASYGTSANLLQSASDQLSASFASGLDLHMNTDGTIGQCSGPDVTSTDRNALSIAFGFTSP